MLFQTRHYGKCCENVTRGRQSREAPRRVRRHTAGYRTKSIEGRAAPPFYLVQKGLPAIAAVAAISTVAAAPSTTAAMSATATTATETAATTATAALLLGTSFVDHQIAAAEVLAIHGIDGAVSFIVIGDFDESKTAGLAGKTIANEIDSRGIDTCLREILLQGILRCGERKITNVKLLH